VQSCEPSIPTTFNKEVLSSSPKEIMDCCFKNQSLASKLVGWEGRSTKKERRTTSRTHQKIIPQKV